MIRSYIATVIAVLIAGGCTERVAETPSEAPAIAAPRVVLRAPPPLIPSDVRMAVVQRICREATCTGELAGITIFRNPGDGTVARLIYTGSMENCSHAPTHYYGADGAELGVSTSEPYDPNDETSVASRATHRANTEGFRRAELIRCVNVAP